METTTALYNRLEDDLQAISKASGSILELARLSHNIVEKAMLELKDFIMNHSFQNAAEEITFFKEIKPKFSSKLIYYIKLFEIEANYPDGPVKAQKRYLNKKLGGITRFFEDNQSFYKYYRSGAQYMDEAYFLRDKFNILVGLDTSYFDCDPSFCTSYDYKLAKLLANEQLISYLDKKLRIENNTGNNKPLLDELGLIWADTKMGIVEIIYGLHGAGAFYNVKTKSKADVKDIARLFEIVLNVDLGNYYRLFYDIRLRKKERTVFVDKVKNGLIKRMDEPDDV